MSMFVKRDNDGSFALACTSRPCLELGVTAILSEISLKSLKTATVANIPTASQPDEKLCLTLLPLKGDSSCAECNV